MRALNYQSIFPRKMNGCLLKTLLIMTVAAALFLGYPYVKQYTSNSMQDKINSLETKGDFLKKFVRQLSNQKSTNDNTENKETGK